MSILLYLQDLTVVDELPCIVVPPGSWSPLYQLCFPAHISPLKMCDLFQKQHCTKSKYLDHRFFTDSLVMAALANKKGKGSMKTNQQLAIDRRGKVRATKTSGRGKGTEETTTQTGGRGNDSNEIHVS